MTPVAFVSTQDQSAGEISCKLVDVRQVMRGVRYGARLAEVLEALLL